MSTRQLIMKNNLKIIIFALCLIFIVGISIFIINFSGNKEELPEVLIINSTEKMSIGNNIKFDIKIINENGGKVLWISSDSNVVQIEQNGLAFAKTIGSSKITAMYIDENGRSFFDSFDIIVSQGDSNVLPQNVSFAADKIGLKEGDVYKLPLAIEPDNAYLDDINYESSVPSLISVSKNGTVTALKEGEFTIALRASNGQFTDKVGIIVSNQYQNPKLIIEPSEFKFNDLEMEVIEGNTLELQYTTLPSNITEDVIKWSSSDESVATVKDGVVVGVNAGKCVITAKATNGINATIVIEVIKKEILAENISLTPLSMILKVGQSNNIIPNITPSDATNKDVKYFVNDESVVTVVNGQVTALKEGVAIVTASTNNNVKEEIIVNVVSNSIYDENIDNVNQNSSEISVILKSSTNTLRGNYDNLKSTSNNISIAISQAVAINGIKELSYCTYKYGNNACDDFKNIDSVGSYFVTITSSGMYILRIRVIDNMQNVIYKDYYFKVSKSSSSGNDSNDSGTTNSNQGGGNNDNSSSTCGKTAQVLSAYVNGKKISRYEKLTVSMGETLRIRLYLSTSCGSIKQLTRTSADGITGWQEYFSASSSPSVNRYDSSTWVATSYFDWIIKPKKKTNGEYFHLSQTTFHSTANYSQIKSFFNVYVKVVD